MAVAFGLLPFAAYVLLCLLLPTLIAVGTGFVDETGAFTLDTVAALADPVVLRAFASSVGLSALTAVVGAVVGAVAC